MREMPESFPHWYESTTRTCRRMSIVTDLELSIRTTAFLESAGITHVKQLINYTPDELLEIRNFGETSLKEVRQKLKANGLALEGD